ncbi:MAG: hypothetical protein F6K25_28515 [Okeania sp. SIO2G4]|nr:MULTISPECIES: hypothetical protein [unclassified Okeania]NEP03422.1 hypothetical protein [Okeania sp. SIO4D6]NEP73931.1 hypothetical protein [Okeania sp. SIO2G5]NEP94745.1 hypothetical protein [Okeania sp. SIO2F5]NEQ94383.1 hypothetical protein [Okeania sp. SIO2G4]
MAIKRRKKEENYQYKISILEVSVEVKIFKYRWQKISSSLFLIEKKD